MTTPIFASINARRLFEGAGDRKYPLILSLHYKIGGADGAFQTGSGRTLEMSRSGVLFEADQAVTESLYADLCIDWPASLSPSVGLTLRVRGPIEIADRNRATLILTNYEFRTRSLPADHAAMHCFNTAGSN